jgi:hypothetical protein
MVLEALWIEIDIFYRSRKFNVVVADKNFLSNLLGYNL